MEDARQVKLQVLVVEDSEDDAWLLIHELRRGGYQVTYERVETAAAMVAALDRQPWDLIVSDYYMPHFSGMAALQIYQEHGLDIPFIIVSGAIGEDIAVAMMKAGASDYLLKGNLARLVPAVERELRETEVRRQRQRVQAALQESEARYRRTIDSLGDALHVVDRDLRIVLCNETFRRLLVQSGIATDPLGKNLLELLPSLPPQAQEEYQQVLESGDVLLTEEVITIDGQPLWAETRRIPILDERGRVYQIVTVVRDITERKRIEESLRRHTAQLEALRQVSLELTAQTELETLLRSIVTQAVGLLAGTSGALFLHRPPENCLECVVAIGLGVNFVGLCLARGEGASGRVLESGQPLVISDYRTWTGRSAQIRGEDIVSLLSVPICWGTEFLGVLDVFSTEPDVFTTDDAELLMLFTAQAAIALRNAQTLAAEEQQRLRAEALVQATAALTTTLELEALLENLLKAAMQVIPAAEKGSVLLPIETTGELCVHAAVGYHDPRVHGFCLPPGVGYAGLAFREQRPLLVPDASVFLERYDPGVDEVEAIQAAIATPLSYHDRVIGVISLDNASRRAAFTEEDLALLMAFADQAAVAVENARLFEQARAERDRLASLYEASRWLAGAYTLEGVTQQLPKIIPLVRAEYCDLILFRTHEPPFLYSSTPERSCLDPEQVVAYVRQVTTEGLQSWVLAQRRSALVVDTRGDPRWVTLPGHEQEDPVRSVVCIPLFDRPGNIMGTLSYEHSRPDVFSPADLRLAEEIGVRVAVALENARLFDETRRRLAREQQLNELAHAVGGEMELAPLLRRFLPAAARLAGADAAAVNILQPDGETLVGLYNYGLPEHLLGERMSIHEGIAGLTCQQRGPVLVPDYREYAEAIDDWVQAGLRSVLSVPLLAGDEVLGALGLFSLGVVRSFSAEAVVAAQAAARLAAVALQRARLFEEERQERQLSEALAEAAAVISRSLDPDQILDHILEQVARVVPGDAFNIMLMTSDTVAQVVRWRGYEQLGDVERVSQLKMSVNRYPNFQKMIQTGKPLLVPNTETDLLWVPTGTRHWQRSYVGAPIQVRGIVVGFLNVSGTRPGQFTPSDAQRLEAFASQVSTALANANLFSQLDQAHQRLQQLYQELQDHAGRLDEEVRERTAQIRAQMAQLEAILNSTSDGILVTDAEGQIVFPPNPVAQQWLTQLPPADGEQLRALVGDLARRAAEHPKAVLELQGLDLQLSAAPIAVSGDERATVVVVAHDISQLKALDRMKSQFVSNVSHELRTPITTIKLYAYMMRRGRPEKREEYMAALEKEADRQAQLVGDVLQISQIDAGKLVITPRPTSMDDLGRALVASHEALAHSSELTLEYRPVVPGLWVFVDPDKIRLVLNNLVENALRYTGAGGQVVVLTEMQTAHGRSWVTVTVSDTGMGIPEEELPMIFERFYRGEQPRQLQLPGTGLGLAIVKEVTELHGGWVTVESQVGVGSKFTVWLPWVEAPTENAQTQEAESK